MIVCQSGRFAIVGGGLTVPTYIGAGALVDHGSSSSTTLNVPYPSGIQAGDIAIIARISISAVGTDHTLNTPSGWTQISENAVVLTYARQGIFYKRLTGSETGTVASTSTIGGAAQDGHSAVMVIYRGCVASGTPYEAQATTSGQSTSVGGSAVTTTGPDRLVLNIASHRLAGTTTPASGWTEDYDLTTTTGDDNGQASFSKFRATAGTEAAVNHTLSISDRWRTVSLALLPT